MKIPASILLSACLLASGCSAHKQPAASDLFNDQAKVDAALPYPVMQWRTLTVSVDRGTETMATLFGNDAAVNAARSGAATYPEGTVLGLVTWRQREDPHWFGGRIPDQPLSVEFVKFGGGDAAYRKFAGSPLKEQVSSETVARVKEIEAMKVARLP